MDGFDDECPGGPPPLGERPLVLVAAVALVDTDSRVLIAQRPAGKSMAGLWEFPGGKVDPGETPEQALERRIRESAQVEERVIHITTQAEWDREVAKVGAGVTGASSEL